MISFETLCRKYLHIRLAALPRFWESGGSIMKINLGLW